MFCTICKNDILGHEAQYNDDGRIVHNKCHEIVLWIQENPKKVQEVLDGLNNREG